jgi:hypothetical protein
MTTAAITTRIQKAADALPVGRMKQITVAGVGVQIERSPAGYVRYHVAGQTFTYGAHAAIAIQLEVASHLVATMNEVPE